MSRKNKSVKTRRVRRKERKELSRKTQTKLEQEFRSRPRPTVAIGGKKPLPRSTTLGSKSSPVIAKVFIGDVHVSDDRFCSPNHDRAEVLEVWRCPNCAGLLGIDLEFLEEEDDRLLCPMCENWICLPPPPQEKEANGTAAGTECNMGPEQPGARCGTGSGVNQPQVRR